MRKTITILLAAAALTGLAAHPAAADDPDARSEVKTDSLGWIHDGTCWTPYREGVVGQYGAWGAYHDGCTITLRCDYYRCSFNGGTGSLTRHQVYGQEHYYYYEQTCNVRLRVFDRYGRLKWYRDGTGRSKGSDSGGGYVCTAAASVSATIYRGEFVSVQANGVRSTHPGTARVSAKLSLYEDHWG